MVNKFASKDFFTLKWKIITLKAPRGILEKINTNGYWHINNQFRLIGLLGEVGNTLRITDTYLHFGNMSIPKVLLSSRSLNFVLEIYRAAVGRRRIYIYKGIFGACDAFVLFYWGRVGGRKKARMPWEKRP